VLTAEQLRHGFTIGDRLVEPARNTIRRADGEAHVEPKVMAVLVCLAGRAGEVVTRQEIYDAVWGRAVVSDQALTNCISELRQHLGDDRAGPLFIETVPKRGYRLLAPVRPASEATPAATTGRTAKRRLPLALLALAVVVVPGLLAWWSFSGTARRPASVVVVPFDDPGSAGGFDYLRLALPDEITTLLAASPELVVRPFEHEAVAAPLEAGRSRGATHVVTGHYYLEQAGRLTVAVEAQDVAGERIVWRARLTVPADDLLALRSALAERVRGGLLPALGAAASALTPLPASREAYDLYLRSLGLARHPEPTERAVELLVRAVELDPGFAPAWAALGDRWHAHGSLGRGGEPALEQALAAWQRALELDPGAINPALGIVRLKSESGELEEAYAYGHALAGRFENNAAAQFALAYVYKYGGMLDAAQRHCEAALALDRDNPDLRSCAYAFLYAGKLDRVQAFLDTDEGSFFSTWGTVLLELRRGNAERALVAARLSAPDRHTRMLMEPCLEGRRGTELDEATAAFVAYWSSRRDPELAYGLAPMLEYCGRRAEALDFLERAVAHNFCAYPALDLDPIWDGMREEPRFLRVREDAIACHRRFREAVERAAAGEGS
jgi:DNA-binding winged helix-turn-helix (wHTH) protein/tetratricopeptide (TPR) repeat protein